MTPGSSTSTTSPFLSVPQPLHVILEVIHTASPAIPHSLSHALLPRTIATEKLLTSMGGQLHIHTLAENRTRYEMKIDMEMSPSNQHQGPAGQRKLLLLDDPGSSFSLSNPSNAASTKHHHHHHTSFSKDPTLSDLAKFIERLNGVKMVLHAREKSVFARHLTSCLASWNADISHVPVGVLTVRESDDDEDYGDDAKKKQEQPVVPSPAIAEEQLHSVPPTFILIDDDIETLENKLKAFHNHQRRPSAQQQQQQQHKGGRHHKNAKYTAAIIHFTSLTNYKRLRDMVHSMPIPPTGMPRLVVVPKPAGPRRFLTALHTGWHDATVEPHFMPIATSPSSPSLWMTGDHHGTYQQQHHATTPAPMTGRKDGYMTPHVHDQGNHRRGMSPSSSPGSSMTTTAEQNTNNNGYFNVLRGQSSRPLSPAPPTASNSNRQHKSSPLGVGDDNEGEQGVNERGDETMLFSSSSSPSSQLPPSYPPSVHNNNNSRASPPHNTDQKGLPTSTLPPETPAETPAHDEKEKKDDADTTTPDAANAKVSPSQENKPHHEEMDREVAVGGGVGHEKPSLINSLRRKRTVRLSKKLKSDRGSSSGAFANTVSPPINVLIVEGKEGCFYWKRVDFINIGLLDNMINQAILSTWMKKHKIKCSVASNGQEAVERWKGGGFHLVLVSTFILHDALHEEMDEKGKKG